MKNIRLKILLLLLTLSTIVTVFTLIENAKNIDIVMTKNLSYRSSSLNKILEIPELELRKTEGTKFLQTLDENHIKDQDSKAVIFALLSFTIFLSLICIVIIFIEVLKRRQNVG